MGNTKLKILEKACELFNQHGIADVSIRQIAKEIGISHSNLIYHFKDKSAIVHGLHGQLLDNAINLNQKIEVERFDIHYLFETTKTGFEIVYRFRFFFYDLLYIVKTIPDMRATLIQIEKTRAMMYDQVIQLSIKNKLLRAPDYLGEYDQLIQRIKIYSDHWLASAAIYEDRPIEEIVIKYSKLFMGHFYPYLLAEGKKVYDKQGLI